MSKYIHRINSELRLFNRVREYRLLYGYTQSELAIICNTSKNTISSIERMQYGPTAFLASKLCIALECDFDELFYLDIEV